MFFRCSPEGNPECSFFVPYKFNRPMNLPGQDIDQLQAKRTISDELRATAKAILQNYW